MSCYFLTVVEKTSSGTNEIGNDCTELPCRLGSVKTK